ncbi:MAG: substrate-binding periplasmic protein [Anaerolineae bacterium]
MTSLRSLRALRWILAALPLVVALVACGRPDTSLADVTRRGYLVVGMDASFPPFESIAAGGDPEGLDVDLARLLAARMGLGVEFRNISFDGLYDALAAGQVDAIISALPYDGLRTQAVRYSAGYFDDGLVVVGTAAGVPPSAEALAGTIAVEMGSEAAALLRQRRDTADGSLSSEVTVKQVLSELDAITAVESGAADLGVTTRLSACLAVAAGSPVAIGPALSRAPYVAAVRADEPALAEAVQSAMTDVLGSAEWSASRQRWLGEACR